MSTLREGTHRGYVTDIGLSQTKSGLARVVVRFALQAWYDSQVGDWCDVSFESAEIVAYLILEKKDGSANEINIQNLKDALGWAGQFSDFAGGRDSPMLNRQCQIVLGWNDYNGTRTMQVKWLRPYAADPMPAIRSVTTDEARAIAARIGAQCRAVLGASPAAPAPPMRVAPVAAAPGAPPKNSDDDLPF